MSAKEKKGNRGKVAEQFDTTKRKIIVDIDVWNFSIRAAKPEIQTPMPTAQDDKMAWVENVSEERLNNRVWGTLRGVGLRKAQRLVDQEGGINVSGWYGSIELAENDFVPDECE